MTSGSEMIARSPSPPEPDDDGEEWPVHGIVGEDVDVFGKSRYAPHRISFKFTPSHEFSLPSYEASIYTFLLTDTPSNDLLHLIRSDGKTGVVQMAPTRPGCATLKAIRHL
jgi:hypothetical protein